MYTADFLLQNDFGKTLLVVLANGGSVAVKKLIGATWVTTDLFTTDGGYPLDLFNSTTLFSPSNGAAFELYK